MAGITGIGSGIDINSIVKAMVDAERAPKQGQLDRLQKTTTSKISALGTLRSAVAELSTALGALNTKSAFDKYTTTSSNTSVLTATGTKNLAGSTFNLQVQQLASGSKLALRSVSGGSAAVFNSGTLKLSAGSASLNVAVTAGKNKLSDIRDAINAQGVASGFSASIVTNSSGSRLVINSTQAGDGNDVKVAATEDGAVTGQNSLLSQVYTRTQNFALPELPAGLGSTFKAGTLSIASGASSFNVPVNAGDDLNAVRDAINSAGSSRGVTASVETTGSGGARLVLSSASEAPFTVGLASASSSFALPVIDPLVGTTFRAGTLSLSAGAASLDVNIQDGDGIAAIRDSINASGGNFTASIKSVAGGEQLVLASANGESIGAIGVDLGAGYPYGADYLTSAQPVSNSNLSSLVGSYAGSGFPTPNIAAGDPGFLARAQSSRFMLDGVQQVKNSNTVSDVVDGLTISLVGAQSASDIAAGKTVDVSVAQDKGSVKGSIAKFVDVYNKLVQASSDLTIVVPTGEGKQPVTGALLGDSSVRNLLAGVRKELGSLAGSAGVRTLSDLGITTQRDGKLAIDASKLDKALTDNYDKVADFMAGEGGLMGRLTKMVEPFSKSDGLLDGRVKSLQGTLRSVGKEQAALDLRIEKVQERLFKQFNAMDSLVAQLKKTSEALSGQLAKLPGVVKG